MTNELPIEYQAALRIAETGLSTVDLLKLDSDEYARLTGRPTMGEISAQALGYAPQPPGRPGNEPDLRPAPQQPEPEGIDVANMTMEQYAVLRGQLGMGGREYGRGALDGGATADWIAAAQRQPGRTAWQGRNVQQPPRLEGRFMRQDDLRDTRPVTERFGTPSNSYQVH